MTERRYDPNNPKRIVPAAKPRRVVLPGPVSETAQTIPPIPPVPPVPPPAAVVSKGPEWHNRRDLLPSQVKDPRTLVERAIAQIPGLGEAIMSHEFSVATPLQGQLVAAVIVAQALDRLGERIIEASVLSRR